MRLFLLVVFVNTVSTAAQPDSLATSAPDSVVNHSFARPNEAAVKHLDLDLKVDFQNKVISGKARLFFQNKTNTDKLYLDTRGLVIKRVTLGSKDQKTNFRLGEPFHHLGQPLIIDILPETKSVNVWYETSSGGGALQWLEPQQTSDGTMPFLFTQSQPILARTWIPCQDNPAVRMTYRAKLKVPVGMLAVMSAQNPVKKSPNGVYRFYMPQPIPSYLLALAAGNIEFKKISSRCGVYAEPGVVDKAAWEFADVESMMVATERLYGSYRWQRYDVIVLPPSFPMGGMENPRLTFATPTVLTGDRSLVSLIVHELAHSWSGNLVTNETWNDIWLNEGVTTYIEQRVVEAVYGRKQSEMHALLAVQDLKRAIEVELGPTNPDTRLRPDFTGRDLQNVMNGVSYGKGYLFLRTLEESVGRDRWDTFLRGYFDRFAFQTMTTEKFVSYLNEELIKGDSLLLAKVRLDDWINKPGFPSSIPAIRSDIFTNVEAIAKSFVEGTWHAQSMATKWSTQEIQHFLRSLPRRLTIQQMSELDSAYQFTGSRNGEILVEWFLHTIRSGYTRAYPSLETFLINVGRLKYLGPLYLELTKTPEGNERARRIYAKARPGYHSITVGKLDAILK
jgi:leukotriene-A4 hydrolase